MSGKEVENRKRDRGGDANGRSEEVSTVSGTEGRGNRDCWEYRVRGATKDTH